MATLFLKNADVLVTMDADRREIKDGALLVEDNVIQAIGTTDDILSAHPYLSGGTSDQASPGSTPGEPASAYPLSSAADVRVINASGTVVLPGLVNCHHHLYQTLTRTVGTAGGMVLFDWLKTLYPIWAEMDGEAVYVSAKVGLSELVLSGATTVADHLYLFPNGATLDDEIRAAQEVGVRFHPTRGSMSLGESKGGLPPDRVCDDENHILKDSQRVIERFHDPEPYSMLRIGLAPCSPFSVTTDLMRKSAVLARQYPLVNLHTHLAETKDEDRFCQEMFGMRPVEYAASVGWLGEDVWFAHMVHPNQAEVERLGHTHTGVCHCPTSNMILASGIAPIREMLDNGVRVGLGLDGSASNDGNHMLGEARQAMLLQRVGWPGFESRADRLPAREALELATLGGAQVLRRDDIGSLEPGKAADFVAFRIDDLAHAGGLSDPVAAIVTCVPTHAWLSVINGRVIVEDGELHTVELDPLVEQHNQISRGMLERAGRA